MDQKSVCVLHFTHADNFVFINYDQRNDSFKLERLMQVMCLN